MDSCCRLSCFHQQEAQQGIALLADVPQPLLAPTGVLTRNHPHVGADLLAPFKPSRSSDDQHVGERRERAHAGMAISRRTSGRFLLPARPLPSALQSSDSGGPAVPTTPAGADWPRELTRAFLTALAPVR